MLVTKFTDIHFLQTNVNFGKLVIFRKKLPFCVNLFSSLRHICCPENKIYVELQLLPS